VQPINFQTRNKQLLERIDYLEKELELATSRADHMKWAC